MTPQVASLIQLAQQGSAESLGELLRRYRSYLKVLASTRIPSFVQGRAGSSDLVQEVCLQAHQSILQFRGSSEGEFLAWLRSILASHLNRILEQHLDADKRDLRREVSLHALAESLDRSSFSLETLLIDRSPPPGSRLEQEDVLAVLSDELSMLSGDHQQVLMLRHIEGLTFPKVAEQMGRSQGAVRMLWFRAIDQLRIRLRERGLL